MERQQPDVPADRAETVDIAVADLSPAVELDAELEAPLRLTYELRLVDFEQAIEGGQVRNRRLADTDNADLFGFDQHHLDLAAIEFGNRGGGHPAG